jgi:hypothetical protein
MKHVITGFRSIKDGDASLTVTGDIAKIRYSDRVTARAWWAGTQRGKVVFEVSLAEDTQNIRWYELQAVQIDITTDNGEMEVNADCMNHALVRAKFVPTSGAGVINVEMNTKSIGG